jgi:hypothetical protein
MKIEMPPEYNEGYMDDGTGPAANVQDDGPAVNPPPSEWLARRQADLDQYVKFASMCGCVSCRIERTIHV